MITEQELKDKCTPEFIKWMCKPAEGFSFNKETREIELKFLNSNEFYTSSNINIITAWGNFPLLIRRAVEGWNKKAFGKDCIVISDDNLVFWSDNLDLCRVYDFKNYQPESLTLAENAMLHCLLDIFSEQEERDE